MIYGTITVLSGNLDKMITKESLLPGFCEKNVYLNLFSKECLALGSALVFIFCGKALFFNVLAKEPSEWKKIGIKQKNIFLKKLEGGIGKIKFALTFAPAPVGMIDGGWLLYQKRVGEWNWG